MEDHAEHMLTTFHFLEKNKVIKIICVVYKDHSCIQTVTKDINRIIKVKLTLGTTIYKTKSLSGLKFLGLKSCSVYKVLLWK